ncbi:DUF1338 domain-containing protein [Fulvitalea axinellae]|uniref:2-oxoadipate dioxygenase/decarboxylase n=1 Tax=Fulvitalea axinellae TaxID=1182444 RepID=A0AAU9CC91_9BACT|nr:DUF1338 domain-containing protein [Fulvitalea axinellae]
MNISTLDQLLDKLWSDYITLNPHALEIHNIFVERDEDVINDHIAFRTFNHPSVCVDVLAKPFLASGYVESGNYDFPSKKLNAKHFEHPDKTKPKIFISELRLEDFDAELNEIVNRMLSQVPENASDNFAFCVSGRPWTVTLDEYEKLLEKSEYAAWLSVFGFRANHFTVLANELNSLDNMTDLNALVRENGFLLNESGGAIKGSKDQMLEQSSTLAGKVDVTFDCENTKKIPACYYEFAMRYPKKDGELFQGFIAKSADKIFESTNQRKS